MGGDSIPMRNFRCGAPWRHCTDGISQKISAGMGLQASPSATHAVFPILAVWPRSLSRDHLSEVFLTTAMQINGDTISSILAT